VTRAILELVNPAFKVVFYVTLEKTATQIRPDIDWIRGKSPILALSRI